MIQTKYVIARNAKDAMYNYGYWVNKQMCEDTLRRWRNVNKRHKNSHVYRVTIQAERVK